MNILIGTLVPYVCFVQSGGYKTEAVMFYINVVVSSSSFVFSHITMAHKHIFGTLQRVFSYSLEIPHENLLSRACPTVSSLSVFEHSGISAIGEWRRYINTYLIFLSIRNLLKQKLISLYNNRNFLFPLWRRLLRFVFVTPLVHVCNI